MVIIRRLLLALMIASLATPAGSQDRFITVVKGTWWVSLGPESDTYDPAKMVPMKQWHPVFAQLAAPVGGSIL